MNDFGQTPRSRAYGLSGPHDNSHIYDPARREHFVYLIFDADDECLYVGCSKNPELRWRAHQSNPSAGWTCDARRFQKGGPYNFRTARDLERELIEKIQPRGNKAFTKFGQTARSKAKSA